LPSLESSIFCAVGASGFGGNSDRYLDHSRECLKCLPEFPGSLRENSTIDDLRSWFRVRCSGRSAGRGQESFEGKCPRYSNAANAPRRYEGKFEHATGRCRTHSRRTRPAEIGQDNEGDSSGSACRRDEADVAGRLSYATAVFGLGKTLNSAEVGMVLEWVSSAQQRRSRRRNRLSEAGDWNGAFVHNDDDVGNANRHRLDAPLAVLRSLARSLESLPPVFQLLHDAAQHKPSGGLYWQ
jgi:hypothetical protein